jgi:EF hand
MTLRLPLALALATVALAGPALAAPHDGTSFIHDYDADKDGKVTRAEFDAGRVSRFKATDANGDGWLSEAEYVGEYRGRLEAQLAASSLDAEKKTEERQRQMRQAKVRFGVLDKDRNQQMTQAEYDASGARAFAEQDADRDGTITLADVAATDARRMAARDKGA